jgi:signal transduction histidine kinase
MQVPMPFSSAVPQPHHEPNLSPYDDAVAGLREPFVIFDDGEGLVVWNGAFAELHRDECGVCVLRPGMSIDELSAWRLASGFFHSAHVHNLDTEPSVHKPGQGKGAIAYQLRDGRWMLVERYPLANGQNVGLWIDITNLKRTEMLLRETAERLSLREAELSETQAALEHTNEDLERRVEERTRELVTAQADILKKERLAAIGQLTATVAHELRNPMSAIRNTVFAMKEQQSRGQPVDLTRPLDRIARSVERCDKIIEELLDYSRSRELQREAVAFDGWLNDILAEVNLPAVELIREWAADNVKVAIDVDRLRRVVINLVENAAQAMAEHNGAEHKNDRAPRIVLRTRQIERAIELQIEDNGPGIPPDNLAKVFEPLFTTKRQGTGLGLPTVKQIVEQHGGAIVLESTLGEFTRAVIRLPLA